MLPVSHPAKPWDSSLHSSTSGRALHIARGRRRSRVWRKPWRTIQSPSVFATPIYPPFPPKKVQKKSMIRFANFKLITVCKINREKLVINILFLIVSPREQQVWSLLCQHFNLAELNPAGCCVLCKKCWSKTISRVLRTCLEAFSTWQDQAASHASPFLIKIAFCEEKKIKSLPKICYLWKTNLLLQDRL